MHLINSDVYVTDGFDGFTSEYGIWFKQTKKSTGHEAFNQFKNLETA